MLNLQKYFKKFLNRFYKILSPPFCTYCLILLEDYYIFCSDCFAKITPVVSCSLDITPKFKVKVYSVSDYKYPLKKLILAKIFSDQLASKQLAQIIWDKTNISNLDFDFIIPVPLHWTRFANRGFNQAEIMAKEISIFSGKPVINIIKRNKKTLFQRALLSRERQVNLKNAFELRKDSFINNFFNINKINYKIYENKKFLIVDDLMTTGSTLVSLSKELKKLNPESINAVVGCRTI